MRTIPLNLSDEELRQRIDKERLDKEFPDEASLIRHLYHEEQLSQREVGVVLGCHQGTVGAKMQKYKIEVRSKAEVRILAWGYAGERKPFYGDDNKKCYLMGFVKGDCHVRKVSENSQTIIVECNSTVPEQIELFERLFGPFGHIWKRKPDERGEVSISANLDRENFAWLLGLGDRLPPLALAGDENFFAFLGGYSDAEGYIGIHAGNAIFYLGSYDKGILRQIHEKLVKLGIELSRPKVHKPKGTTFINRRTGKVYRTNQDLWCLKTTCKKTLLRLFERLGPYLNHSRKREGMETAIKNIKERDIRWERARERKKRFEELFANRVDLPSSFSSEAKLIYHLYHVELLSKAMIARLLGCSDVTVGNKMRRYGIETRTMSEAVKIACGYSSTE